MIYVSMRDSDAMRNVSMIGFQLQQHHMLNVITDFKAPVASDENRIRSWYLAELAVCKACPFAVACEYRKNPCIIMTSDGYWNRTMLQKKYPELIEKTLAEIQERAGKFDGYLGMMLDQETKHRAKKLGFHDAEWLCISLQEETKCGPAVGFVFWTEWKLTPSTNCLRC